MRTERLQLHGIGECSERLGVSCDTVRRLVKTGKLRFVRIRSRLLIPSVEVDRLLNEGSENDRNSGTHGRR
jgi:excisionase family DNA binding protein